jgi:hypothetical protein
MPTGGTTGVDLHDIIGFSSVYIPRLVTWRDLGEALAGVDFGLCPWYYYQVTATPPRHKNPAYLQNSHFVIYGVFYCLSMAKYLIFLAFHINVIPLRTQGKVGLGGIRNETERPW